ncbi:hypothetical protein [uncultured Pedobacter sp.]|uniref:hypothetical protein n=1 Tax=uncultured Pedobacter sp. TaxID=246139 RepID=UPI0025FE2655|nr:hypothetical protein [uncultured Pedobacter sp.]
MPRQTLKTFLNDYHLIFSLLIASTAAIIGLSLLSEFQAWSAVLVTALGFGIYYLAMWICSAEANFTHDEQTLEVTLFARNLNIYRTLHIPLATVRGFGLEQITRGSYSIIIYLANSDYHKFSVRRYSEAIELEAYLSTFLNKLTKDTHPKYPDFLSGFAFAIKKVAFFLIITTIFAFIIVEYAKFSNFLTFILCACFNITAWLFIIRKPIKKALFRFGAFYVFPNLFIYLAPLLAIIICWKTEEIRSKPISFKKPHELIAERPYLFYRFDRTVINPKIIDVSTYVISTNSNSRERTFNVTHYFATPLASVDSIRVNGRYNIWLVKTFKQKIRKDLGVELRSNLIQHFHNETKIEFENLFRIIPAFYKNNFNDRIANQLLYGNLNASKQNYILVPHWEEIQVYKNEQLKEIYLLVTAIIILSLVGCIFIAVNR